MNRKIMALLLCVVLCAAMLPISAFADTQEETVMQSEEARIRAQITSTYRRTVGVVGDLRGYCGEMAAWELYFLGITQIPLRYNGNEMYDVLCSTDQVTPGYKPQFYSAKWYSLEEALNAITAGGTVDAYNLVAGYHWTTTAAGRLFGHVTMIHAILDGMVYFTEGFSTPIQKNPSQPMVCTISEFADYYNQWTGFEGIVYFGKNTYVEGYENYDCNTFVVGEEEVSLLTNPNVERATVYRTCLPGERLRAVGLCQGEDGALFYQIEDDNVYCYVPTYLVDVIAQGCDGLQGVGISMPNHLNVNQGFHISGTISSAYRRIEQIVVEVLDMQGASVLNYEFPLNAYAADMDSWTTKLNVPFAKLAEGQYTCVLSCDLKSHRIQDNQVEAYTERVTLEKQPFVVGNPALEAFSSSAYAVPARSRDGWVADRDGWRYYEDGKQRKGWLCENGLDYYLQENGVAATGWVEINGKLRYFSSTGVMRTGWVQKGNDRYYMLSNGEPATGWRNIKNQMYYFTPKGTLDTGAVYVNPDML